MTTKSILCAAALFGCFATTVVPAQEAVPKKTVIGSLKQAKAKKPKSTEVRWVDTTVKPTKTIVGRAVTAAEPTPTFGLTTSGDDGWKKKAKAAMAKGDYAKAMQIAARALSKNPKDKAAMEFLLAAQKRMTGGVVSDGFKASDKPKAGKTYQPAKAGQRGKDASPNRRILELREVEKKLSGQQRAKAEAQKIRGEFKGQMRELERAKAELEALRKKLGERARRGEDERARVGEWVYRAEGEAKRAAEAKVAREIARVRGEEARASRERAVAEAARARETARILRERVRGQSNDRPDRDNLIEEIRVVRESARRAQARNRDGGVRRGQGVVRGEGVRRGQGVTRGGGKDSRVTVVRGQRTDEPEIVVEVEEGRPAIARLLRGVAAREIHEHDEHEHEHDEDELEEELDEIEDELEELRDEVGEMREELGEMRELLEILVRRLSDRPARARRSVGRVVYDDFGQARAYSEPTTQYRVEYTPMEEFVVEEVEVTEVEEEEPEEAEEIEVEVEVLEAPPGRVRVIREVAPPSPPKPARGRARTGGGSTSVRRPEAPTPPTPPKAPAPAVIATVPAPPAPPAPPKPAAAPQLLKKQIKRKPDLN